MYVAEIYELLTDYNKCVAEIYELLTDYNKCAAEIYKLLTDYNKNVVILVFSRAESVKIGEFLAGGSTEMYFLDAQPNKTSSLRLLLLGAKGHIQPEHM